MKKVLFDLNIWIDITLRADQQPASVELFRMLRARQTIIGFPLCGFTTFVYLIEKAVGRKSMHQLITDLSSEVLLCPFSAKEYNLAVSLGGGDLEDNCVAATALVSGFTNLVTRNKKDFKDVILSVRTPKEVMQEL